jgi:hypothetical protein
LALWHRLGLEKLLGELMEPGREAVGWPTVASVLVAAPTRFDGATMAVLYKGVDPQKNNDR